MAIKRTEPNTTINEQLALSLLPKRLAGAHKWSIGGVLIIGGAPGYIGAPALAARAAGRSGAGIVSVAASRTAVASIATLVPEATFVPLPDGETQSCADRANDLIGERLERCKAVVVGPGLSQDDQATALLAVLFGRNSRTHGASFGFGSSALNRTDDRDGQLLGAEKPSVVDADALTWLSTQDSWWSSMERGTLVLTPHEGEMARLLDVSAAELSGSREELARQAAATWNQIVVLKGHQTVVTDGQFVRIGPLSPLSLATAGTGDVLAGSIGAFLAQGLSPLDAAALAIYLGCRAAEDLQATYGVLGVVAGDLPDAIGLQVAELERSQSS
ncbi:hypothetical protein BH23CHL5_BH23CHL5_03580 [soil metagenome]